MIQYYRKLQSTHILHFVTIALVFALFVAVQPASAQKVTLGFRSIAGHSLAVFNGQMFMAFIGTDNHHSINVASSSDGLTWETQVVFGFNHSFDSPAITAFKGRLYLAWTGAVGSGSLLNIASSADGLHFLESDHHILPGSGSDFTSAHGVALAATASTLYYAWDNTSTTRTPCAAHRSIFERAQLQRAAERSHKKAAAEGA